MNCVRLCDTARVGFGVCALLICGFAAASGTGSTSGVLTPAAASRFLQQATLGANWEEIHRTADLGTDGWLEEQLARPIGYHQPYLDQRQALGLEVDSGTRRWSWWRQVMDGPDPLRQRVALALSEIVVVSDEVGDLRNNPIGMANYYDMLLDHAFGNYRDLLYDVTMHPIMGVYLSHLRNRKSDPARGLFPDENYAREIMQLFSIGLFELYPDGSLRLDGAGLPIPSYDNEDITEFAKIFTGLSYSSRSGDFRRGEAVWTRPMRMYDAFHEPGAKRLLRGLYLPPGRTGMQDVNDAIDNLFEHPNVGPFIGRKLIQRLITSNPSADYIERVSDVFADNGLGVRGDMRAVICAILLDPEARTLQSSEYATRGMLRESFLRRVHLARAFDAQSPMGGYPIEDRDAPEDFGQRPLSSPTVFNFFMPDHQPTGEIANAGLVAPEFQVLNTITAISSANELRRQVEGVMNRNENDLFEVRLNLSDEVGIATNARALIDRLDLILTYGNMSPGMRQVLIQSVEQFEDPLDRVELAVHLISISPEYSVLK